MLIKASNNSLVEDCQKTFLTAAVAAAATTIVVKDFAGLSNGDYIILGEVGEEGTEIRRIGAAVSTTSITVDTIVYSHGVDTPVYRADYNQCEITYATTLTGTKLDPATRLAGSQVVSITPDQDYTTYEDTNVLNTTGYGFVRWKNSGDTAYSSYSAGVNYTYSGEASSYDPRTLFRITKRVRKLLDEDRTDSKLEDDQIRDAVNDVQRDIAHRRLWSFYETEKSFSSITDQWAYDLPSTIQNVYGATLNTKPLAPINYIRWKNLHWDSNTTSTDPTHMCVWNNQLLIYPRPTGTYYKFIIDSEVIYATGLTATTFTGCSRGEENTTAATHLNAAAVTERSVAATATTINIAGGISATAVTITVASTTGFTKFATASTALNDATPSSTDTTITVDSISGFKRGDYYRFIIGIEVIYATNSTSTTFTGCLRGQEGTTAADHSDNDIMIERNIVYSAHEEPTDLFDITDRTQIPEPEIVAIGAASKLAFLINKETLADRLTILYQKGITDLEGKYAMKISSQFGRVKLASEIVSDTGRNLNQNIFPKDINT